MLDFSIQLPEGILVLEPQAPLTKEDFSGPGAAADAYLSDHAQLRGVLIHSKAFPGWKDFAGFATHMRFVRDHHQKVARVAVVTDSALAGILESLGKHFISAKVKHFPYRDQSKALDWLKAAP
ncbi:MAG: STAS/SEC14 domain-containing protein [Burkholderiaceae bacterium]